MCFGIFDIFSDILMGVALAGIVLALLSFVWPYAKIYWQSSSGTGTCPVVA